jgi:hypothetical protein
MKKMKSCPCGAQFEGRADKEYCSAACKSHFYRQRLEEGTATQAQQPMGIVPARPTKQITGVALAPAPEDEAEEYEYTEADELEEVPAWKRWEQERAAERLQQELADLHQVYCEAAEAFLHAEGLRLSLEDFAELLADLEDWIAVYRKHPHLANPEHVARKRLDDLYDMRDMLREDIQAIRRKSFLHAKVSEFHLTDKWRKKLRQRMID